MSDKIQNKSKVADLSGPRSMVVASLRGQIERGEYHAGDWLPAERVLALFYDVSRVTIRAALQELTDQGWLETGKGRRRRIGQSQTASSAIIANCVAVLSAPDNEPFDADKPWVEDRYVMALAANAIEQHGSHVLSMSLSGLRRDGPRNAIFDQLQALMVSSNVVEEPGVAGLIEAVAGAGRPVVLYGRCGRFPDCAMVYSDHRQGAQALTGWLVGHGRRRIACAWMRGSTCEWMDARWAGYVAGMQVAGLEHAPIIEIPTVANAHLTRDGFEHQVRIAAGFLAEHLRGPGARDALCALNDPQAIYLAAACRKLGLVPNVDVWLAGYDNTWRYAVEWKFEEAGPLVTVDKDNVGMARRLSEVMLARLRGGGDGAPLRIEVPAQIVRVQRGDLGSKSAGAGGLP